MPSFLPYSIGCPVWACEGWVGKLYQKKTKTNWLREYSQVFNTVEGNSTFYGLPSKVSVQRWVDTTADSFQFALKFPRAVTHDCQLRGANADTRIFLRLLEILAKGDRLGPTLLQLGPSFSGAQLPDLAKYLSRLPREFPFAVEVRHFDYFDRGDCESRLTELLTGLGMDWVIFDSRALFSRPPSDPIERESQKRKPQTPYRTTVTAQYPIVRFVGRNSIVEVRDQIDQWAKTVAEWIREGLRPYVFTHSPDDTFAPDFAFSFHQRLMEELPELPPLELPRFKVPERQGRLFE